MRPLFRIVAAALCLVFSPALAYAQSRHATLSTPQVDAGAMCRSSCLSVAATAPGGVSERAAHACTIRCNAAQSFAAQQSVRGSAEATGQGRAAAMSVAAGVPAASIGRAGHGAIYAGRAPSPAFGLVVGAGDRLSAHRLAQGECSRSGAGCRPLVEFSTACGAVAQGVQRSQWALMITVDPNTYVVTSVAGGSGATQAQAEADAMAECRSRDRGAYCRVVAAACRTNS
jgi:hypothetical protein